MPKHVGWIEPKSSEITSESLFRNRRAFIQRAGIGLLGLAAAPVAAMAAGRDWSSGTLLSSPLSTDAVPTPFHLATGYNNFYEFGTGKDEPARRAQALVTDPWSLAIEGEVSRPGRIALEDLLSRQTLEERVYRFRCVEGWSMVVPWIGFPLADLLKQVEPGSRARYVEFETLHDLEQMPGQRGPILEWPYREALRIDEAMHPLTLLAVGMYGQVMPNQNGAPIRLIVPWKYGFKSIKSIVRLRLVEEQPMTSWVRSSPTAYGFYANVNPHVRHPRWLQVTERPLGEDRRRRTELFNGYGESVAGLYAGMDLQEHF